MLEDLWLLPNYSNKVDGRLTSFMHRHISAENLLWFIVFASERCCRVQFVMINFENIYRWEQMPREYLQKWNLRKHSFRL